MIEYKKVEKLKENNYIVIDGEPCRILSISKSVSGKHGAAKYRIDAMGIFDNKKRTVIFSSGADVEVPIIEKRKGQILSIKGDRIEIMDLDTYETRELDLPEEWKDKVSEGIMIEYSLIMGREKFNRVFKEWAKKW